jgi:hypothetical protein
MVHRRVLGPRHRLVVDIMGISKIAAVGVY